MVLLFDKSTENMRQGIYYNEKLDEYASVSWICSSKTFWGGHWRVLGALLYWTWTENVCQSEVPVLVCVCTAKTFSNKHISHHLQQCLTGAWMWGLPQCSVKWHQVTKPLHFLIQFFLWLGKKRIFPAKMLKTRKRVYFTIARYFNTVVFCILSK